MQERYLNMRVFLLCISLIWLSACGSGGGNSSTSNSSNDVVTTTPAPISTNPEQSPPRCLPSLAVYRPSEDKPTINLLGAKVVNLDLGDSYLDAGATAEDSQSGDITPDIQVFGLNELDTNTQGDYLIRYEVTDSDQNAALPAYRIVRVQGEQITKLSKRLFSEVDAPWEYFEYLPATFGNDSSELLPLIIVNHGWSHSKRFDASGAMLGMNGQSMVEYLRGNLNDGSLPFIILTPQRCWSDFGGPQSAILNAFVKWAVRNYPVDSRRVYMTGLSMGGWATWEYVRSYSDIAAAAPMAGGGQLSSICGVAPTPIWAFAARNDTVVPAQDVVNTVNALRNCNETFNADAKLTVFESGGHVIDDNVFSQSFLNMGESEYDIFDQSIFDWFLQYELQD